MDLFSLRHSASHILAQAVKHLFPDAKLAIGPAIDNGFYYDFDLEHHFNDDDLAALEVEMDNIVKQNLPLVRKVITRDEAVKLFKDEPYKLLLIDAIPPGDEISIYSQGNFTDLCAGPHVDSTGQVKHFKLLSVAGAYWRGDEHNKMLQRIYGTAFETKGELSDYLKFLKEAAESDHRKLGQQLELFSLHDEAPGEPFFLPNGMLILNQLLTFWRQVHSRYGYKEIRSPIMLKRQLWETSGHWDHYSQGMYTLKVDEEDYAIKPMNCPGAILACRHYLFKVRSQSLKFGEIGLVHRAERSGQLHGLMRVREFTQDDAHIFTTPSRLNDDIAEILQIMDEVYNVFGLTYELELSTRPDDRIGSDDIWDKAESALEQALNSSGRSFKINPGDGAFYGPKIDIHIKDRIGRTWQCGTIQVDFNLPERFDLSYLDENNQRVRPIMLHRVVYGSIERFLGILIEHFKGVFPLWLAPLQVRFIPVSENFADFASQLAEKFIDMGFRADVDTRSETLNKRIKGAALAKIPYTVVIGQKELEGGDLNIKIFGGGALSLSISAFTSYLGSKVKTKNLNY